MLEVFLINADQAEWLIKFSRLSCGVYTALHLAALFRLFSDVSGIRKCKSFIGQSAFRRCDTGAYMSNMIGSELFSIKSIKLFQMKEWNFDQVWRKNERARKQRSQKKEVQCYSLNYFFIRKPRLSITIGSLLGRESYIFLQ